MCVCVCVCVCVMLRILLYPINCHYFTDVLCCVVFLISKLLLQDLHIIYYVICKMYFNTTIITNSILVGDRFGDEIIRSE